MFAKLTWVHRTWRISSALFSCFITCCCVEGISDFAESLSVWISILMWTFCQADVRAKCLLIHVLTLHIPSSCPSVFGTHDRWRQSHLVLPSLGGKVVRTLMYAASLLKTPRDRKPLPTSQRGAGRLSELAHPVLRSCLGWAGHLTLMRAVSSQRCCGLPAVFERCCGHNQCRRGMSGAYTTL